MSSFWYYFILYCRNTQYFSTLCGHKERKNGYRWHFVMYRIILRKKNIYLHVPDYLALKVKIKGVFVAHVEVRSVANNVRKKGGRSLWSLSSWHTTPIAPSWLAFLLGCRPAVCLAPSCGETQHYSTLCHADLVWHRKLCCWIVSCGPAN